MSDNVMFGSGEPFNIKLENADFYCIHERLVLKETRVLESSYGS